MCRGGLNTVVIIKLYCIKYSFKVLVPNEYFYLLLHALLGELEVAPTPLYFRQKYFRYKFFMLLCCSF